MSKVFKLGITKSNNQKIEEVESIEVLANKGIIGDRHFDDYNDPFCQLDFRRNIITKGIKLNNLVGKKFQIGNVKVEGIDLCRPCKHLSEMLNQDNIIKEFLKKGGLRCQILSSSIIHTGDEIKF